MTKISKTVPTQKKQLSEEELRALNKIGTFSLFAMADNGLSIVLFFAFIASLGVVFRDEYAAIHSTAFLTPGLIFMGLLFVVISIIQLISLVYLRSGYGILKKTSDGVRSPYAGVTLYFAGIVVFVIGGFFIVSGAFVNFPSSIPITPLWVISFAGIAMNYVGKFFGLTLGSFRLKVYFNRSTFGHAGILFLAGFHFHSSTLLQPYSSIGELTLCLCNK